MKKGLLVIGFLVSLVFVGCSQPSAKEDVESYWNGYISIAPGVVMVRDTTADVNCYISIRGLPGSVWKAPYPISCVKM